MTELLCPGCNTSLVRGFGLGGLRGSYTFCPNEKCNGGDKAEIERLRAKIKELEDEVDQLRVTYWAI